MNKRLVEFNDKLINKKIAIIGAGVSNIPLFEYLYNYTRDITLFDKSDKLNNNVMSLIDKYNIKTCLGDNYLDDLVGFDIIFRSPSLLPTNEYLVKERERGAFITSEIEQVIALAPCKVIGITGSKGKTTTSTLTNLFLTGMGYSVHIGGNIGIPLFTRLKDIKSNDIIVLELSSFQLMDISVSPNISLVTNISPDHLDVHDSYLEYINAKKGIYLNQSRDDVLVLNYDDDIVREFNKDCVSNIRYFSCSKRFKDSYYVEGNYIKYNDEIVVDTSKILLKGMHNYLNICASLTAIRDYVDNKKVFDIIKDYKGVEHRLEYVRTINDNSWYNDSASTTPDKAMAGIMAFPKGITLIAGGYDKNLDYSLFGDIIVKRVSNLILFGETKDKIYSSIKDKNKVNIMFGRDLEEVIKLASDVTNNNIVLFSPASASFDMFKNAYQRGDLFKEFVNKL